MTDRTLFGYMKETQRLIHDSKMVMIDPADLIDYINRARREVAMRAQCLRILPSITSSILSIDITDGGSGYAETDTLTISAPDFPSGAAPDPLGRQATATLTIINGVIQSVNLDDGGAGYFAPVLTINTETGSGATLTIDVSKINQTTLGQEVYRFQDIDLTPYPGVASIFMVKSISMIYANYRYSLPCYSFSTYQAWIRQYPYQYSYVPTICSQFGQGTNGSLYLYPIASQGYQMEWDCFCLPSDILTDQDVEALPQPWTDAVPYFAAYLAFLELQNFNYAKFMQTQFDEFMKRYSGYARPGRVTNPYGRF